MITERSRATPPDTTPAVKQKCIEWERQKQSDCFSIFRKILNDNLMGCFWNITNRAIWMQFASFVSYIAAAI